MFLSVYTSGYITNLIYDYSKKIPKEIFDSCSKVYDRATAELSKKYEFNRIQIDVFFHQKNVEEAIKEYLRNPEKRDCSNILIEEFFKLFDKNIYSEEEANSILNTFFEVIDKEIKKDPELKKYLDSYLIEQTFEKVTQLQEGQEKQLERKQRAGAFLVVWSSNVLINNPGSKEIHTLVRGAADVLRIPLDVLDDFERESKYFKKGTSLEPRAAFAQLEFCQTIVLLSPETYPICNLIRLASFNWILSLNFASHVTDLTNDELQKLIEMIGLYIEEFYNFKEELVGKFRSDIVKLTETFSELQAILVEAQQNGTCNTLEFSDKLSEITKEVNKNLLLATSLI